MARPREFNHDQVLDAAIATFWVKGYEATSLADLTAAMSLSKSSFYEAFGSKHALFLNVIDRYGETVVAPRLSLLETGNWAGGTIAVLFERIIEAVLAEDPRRINVCLMRYEDAFHDVLVRARDSGEFPPERDLRAIARFLAATLQGLYVMAQAGAGRDALNDIAGGALASLA
jgi:TetR/AcrR family transcriptional repressor of nem operon